MHQHCLTFARGIRTLLTRLNRRIGVHNAVGFAKAFSVEGDVHGVLSLIRRVSNPSAPAVIVPLQKLYTLAFAGKAVAWPLLFPLALALLLLHSLSSE